MPLRFICTSRVGQPLTDVTQLAFNPLLTNSQICWQMKVSKSRLRSTFPQRTADGHCERHATSVHCVAVSGSNGFYSLSGRRMGLHDRKVSPKSKVRHMSGHHRFRPMLVRIKRAPRRATNGTARRSHLSQRLRTGPGCSETSAANVSRPGRE